MNPAPASQVSPITDSWNVRPAPATAKTSPWMIVCSVNLNFAWMGDHDIEAMACHASVGTKCSCFVKALKGSSRRNCTGDRVTSTSRPKSSDG